MNEPHSLAAEAAETDEIALESIELPDVLPVVPSKDAVLFPYIILPLSIGRPRSLEAVERALAHDRFLLLVAQRDPDCEEPAQEDLHAVGTVASVMRMLKLPDGRIRILVQGIARARLDHLGQRDPFLLAKLTPLSTSPPPAATLEARALLGSVKEGLDRSAALGKGISGEVLVIAANLDDPGRLADLVASNLDLTLHEAQELLETEAPLARLERVHALLVRELELLTVQQEITSQARGEMDRGQREYYLRKQLEAIRQELGDEEDLAREIEEYRTLAREREMPEAALEELERQIRRLERSHPESAETSILRAHLDWLTGLPWAVESEDRLDLAYAREVLDVDHYDLEKVKERIVEYLAVRKLKPDARGPILCFVGPPGVGKTSLGRSIARALGRRFVRLSLGGVRDEAEIRGHRRTYVGALPGRILQGLRQAGTSNPVFMLDEVDKLGVDLRGDPSAALLEVLDPEQNSTFVDHYLGLAYDLSKVMFITTANLLDPIQPAFLDRMEVIRLTGYTPEEKLHIARRHLIPKQLAGHGLAEEQLRFEESGLTRIIADYTREAGLRNLEREIAAVCRKVAVRVAGEEGELPLTVDGETAAALLGPPRHHGEELLDRDRVGVATGLAWTAAGGDLLFIEVVAVPGKGKLLLTGQLGEVMRESAQAALSYARVHAARLAEGDGEAAGEPAAGSVPPEWFARHDLHVHVPAGSIPKDGPSAGITIATAVVSVLTRRTVDRRLAMTGEITLRGDVLAIGGIKEKAMAARLAGIRRVIVPRLNRRDVEEIPEAVREGITFHFVDHMDGVLELALAPGGGADGTPEGEEGPGARGGRRGEAPAAGGTGGGAPAAEEPAPEPAATAPPTASGPRRGG